MTVDVVNDDGVDWYFPGFEFKAERFAEGGEKGRQVGVDVETGGVENFYVVDTEEAGLIYDGEADDGSKQLGEEGNGAVVDLGVALIDAGTPVDFAVWLAGRQFGAAFRNKEGVAGEHAGFMVDGEVEAVFEKLLKTGPQFFAGENDAGFRFGGDVEEIGVEPGGFVGDLAWVDVPGEAHEQSKRDAGRVEAAGVWRAPFALAGIARRVDFDGGHFEDRELGNSLVRCGRKQSECYQGKVGFEVGVERHGRG